MTNTTGESAASAPPPPAPADPSADLSPAVSRRAGGELRTRIISAVCLAPVVLWAMWRGGDALLVMLTMTAGAAAGEWAAMHADAPRRRILTILAVLAGGGIFWLSATQSLWWLTAGPVVAVVFAAAGPADRRVLSASGLPYVTIGVVALAVLAGGHEGRAALFFVVLAVWATDIGAYAAGRTIGGPKLAPRLSPKKTWAGLLGGMTASAAVCVAVGATAGGAAPLALAAVGAVLAVVAQAGDLFESWAKRRAGVKDSSKLIPGHGGLLDRIDGLLTAAPACALFQAATGPLFG